MSNLSNISLKNFIQFIFIFIVLGLLAWFAYDNNLKQQTIDSLTSDSVGVMSEVEAYNLLQTATIVIPETTTVATLINGMAEYPLDDVFPISGSVVLGDSVLVTKTEVFATLVVNSGGTGNFLYLASFRPKGKNLEYKSSVFLGDRIIVEGMVINTLNDDGSYTLDVAILDRRETEPMSVRPTIPRTLNFLIEDGLIKGDFFN